MKQSVIIGIVVVVAIVIIAGVLLGMQNSGNNDNAPSGDNPVRIADFAYSPAVIVVHINDTVTWRNNDGVVHTVTSDSNSTIAFDSGNMGPGSTYAFTFTQAGDFWYLCTPHPSMAHAMVRVLPAAG